MGLESAGGDVPVSCWTSERKSPGSVLYTCGAGRGCVTVRRKFLLIFNDDLLTESAELLLPLPPSESDRSIGAAVPPVYVISLLGMEILGLNAKNPFL